MSEPVTHAEIEDVLSSIRRLVSEDGRDTSVPKPPEPAKDPAARLVLTPSLRVADVSVASADDEIEAKDISGEDLSAGQPEPKPDPQTETSGNLPKSSFFGTRFQEHHKDKSNTQPSDEMANEHPAVTPSDEPVSSAMPSPTDEAPWQDPDATLFAAVGADEIDSASLTTEDGADPSVSFAEKIAALETAIGHADEQWEPDGDSGEANAGTVVETLAWEDLEEDLGKIASSGAVGAESEESADTSLHADVTLEIDEPETATDTDTDTLDAFHLAEQAISDEVLSDVSAEDSIMDEESLRELVADIVREELQGALGERITRNVRKLVRREIHRALAVQDLG